MFSLLLPIIYVTFISLGLPDSLLGSAWPAMYPELGAPVAAQSLISITISLCTVISSLLTIRLVDRLGTGKLCALSVSLTAIAILGFSFVGEFWQLWMLALPYGLGAGAIDAALNNYVALNYGPRHMSWLHCCWGIGASAGPVIMSWAIAGASWHTGYLAIGCIQAAISAMLFLSLPLWKKTSAPAQNTGTDAELDTATTDLANGQAETPPRLSMRELFHLPGAAAQILSFGAYNALEASTGLWMASYLVLARGFESAVAASVVSLFYLGITVGRFVSGSIANAVSCENQIRIGQAFILAGIVLLVTAPAGAFTWCAVGLIGFGCAPIYPCVVALTPHRFGAAASQGLVSLQMACAYSGSSLVPPLFGLIAGAGGAGAIPLLQAALLLLLFISSERARKKAR